MSTPTFEEIVRAWILFYDDRLPSDRKARREAFITLLGNLDDHGYTREEVSTTSKKEKIVRVCVNPFHNKNKLKKWSSMVVNDLEAAILIYYPIVKIRDNVVTQEMQAKLESMDRKAEESRALRKHDNDDSEDADGGPINLETDPIDIDIVVKEAMKSKQTEFDITDEFIKEHGLNQEVIWDEDFEKNLKKLEEQNE